MAIVGIALHGICNDFVLILGAMYIAEIAPIGAKAQAQSLFVFLTSGLGTFIGSLVRGEIFNGVVAAHPRTGPELFGPCFGSSRSQCVAGASCYSRCSVRRDGELRVAAERDVGRGASGVSRPSVEVGQAPQQFCSQMP